MKRSRCRLTTYRLVFRKRAQKAFDKLGTAVQRQLAKKLTERLSNSRVSAHALQDMPNCYRIKLRSAGFRLIYRVEDERMVVLVIAVGPRERNEAYDFAINELTRL